MWNISKLELPDDDQYKYDIDNIYMADIGNLNALHSNQFFQEACQLIINSINLYKLGYFDAAFYSLRQAIEVSIEIIYINSDKERLNAWRRQEDGFESGKMKRYLEEKEPIFKDVRTKMKLYFDSLFAKRRKNDKYIHKQGFKTFYTTYKQSVNKSTNDKYREIVKADYIDMLESTIGAVAIYRLIFDPLPVLLMEEEIAYRSPDFLTEAYSEKFVKKYIGSKNLELYKSTEIYQGYKEDLLSREKQSQAVFDIIHFQYFDTKALEVINKQLHLLSLQDKIAFFIYSLSTKTSCVIVDGWIEYFSDVKIDQAETVLGEDVYQDLFISDNFNYEHTKFFISRIKINDKYTIIKHVAQFSPEEKYNLMILANVLTEKIQEEEKELKDWLKAYTHDKHPQPNPPQ